MPGSNESFGTFTVLVPSDQRQTFVLSKADISIGRAPTSDIVLNDGRVSRTHAFLACNQARCKILDAGAANGLTVNGIKVTEAELVPGDLVVMGDTTLQFQRPATDLHDTSAEFVPIHNEEELTAELSQATVAARVGETLEPRLMITTPRKTWEVTLGQNDLAIGRLPENDIVLDSIQVSRRHARIERAHHGYNIRDLGGENGTWMNGTRVTCQPLHDMDTVRIGDAHLLFQTGFTESDLTLLAPVQKAAPRTPVVVIPGFFGSNLWLGKERVWPSIRNLKLPEVMKWSDEKKTPLVPRGLVDEVVIVPNVIRQEQYGGLISFLEEALGYERGKDLWEFAYDFRQDLRVTAQQLSDAINAWHPHGPVTILAHSMGTLISRYYVDQLGGDRHVKRLILLGGPHAGSPKAVINLAVQASLLPFGFLGERIQEVLLTYPAIYTLLPEQPCGTDERGRAMHWLHDPSWLPSQYHKMLQSAADFRQELRKGCRVPTLCVFGYGMKTLTNLRVARGNGGLCTKIEGAYELLGDGTVPEVSAVIPGADIHPIRQYHGTLHVDADVRKRLKVELSS